MSKNEEETKAPEIMIIRRGGHGGEEGHHGGVWKIAYADFMTAMMAFFLVMWLINSSDKKTLTQVATYFNPLRLTDKSAASKGLHEAHSVEQTSEGDEVQSSGSTPGGKKEKGKKESKGDPKGKFSEESIFQDPLAVLDRIAADAKEAASEAAKARTAPETPESVPGSTEQIRDPFDPGFRLQQVEVQRKQAEQKQAGGPQADKTAAGGLGENPDQSKVGGLTGENKGPGGIGDLAEKRAGLGDAEQTKQASPRPPAPERKETKKPDDKAAEIAAAEVQVKAIERELKMAVAQTQLGSIPNIEVTNTEEGILISITDDYDFGMFAVSSAEPRPQLVLVMEKLAGVLAKQTEPLILRGHTDGRQYKKGNYDNWRLSTARAHMAYYMLVRGGLEEGRFEKVEGYADKRLRQPQDPLAAPNRRIEILLRRPKA